MKPKIGMAALLLAAGLISTGVAHATPPDHAPAHGYRAKHVHHHKYVYYPAQQVYYAPTQGVWFWLNGGTWQAGASLPVRYHAYRQYQGIPVTLDTSRPYVKHVYVEKHYGRPWREKHRHSLRHRHDRDHDHGRDD
ncbi:hypothetical protein Q8A64_16190 [Oxalobacteraceae bacterium R-40]|uniref:Uncharacterized protein n=1 Tax=Keguizhuia sedimenti TaxID=3064264 RepID=A0ABU1BSI3_9BURK|nr:hypothetical protein [Oxalobacteraceae bacterium R-40]